jgi:hypothetical protein
MAFNFVIMTPRDKVNDLILRFSKFSVGMTTCYLSEREAKQCAIIAVDEILNDGKMKYCGEGITDAHYKFWEDVKVLLNAL